MTHERTVAGACTGSTATRSGPLGQVPDRKTREMIVATGMEDGLQDALDLLEQLVRA